MSSIHVVAMGARTPVGLTAAASAAAVRAKVTRIAEHPFMVDMRGEPIRLARDALLPPDLFGRARMVELGRSALAQVVDQLGAAMSLPEFPIPLLLGLAEERYGWSAADATQLAEELGREPAPGPGGWTVLPFSNGHASVLDALRHAVELLTTGQAHVCVLGGVDTYLDPNILLWLDGNLRLAAEGIRSGTVPGEGAGFLALANDFALPRLGLPSLGTVRAVGTAQESKLNGTSAINLGEGLTAAIEGAASRLAAGQELIDDVYCDINGERYRTEEWGFAVLRTLARLRDATSYVSAVSQWGDVGAASGALLSILALRAFHRGYARGPLGMVWASSEPGLRGAAILQAPTGR